MKQLLKSAYNLLKTSSEHSMKHIVFTETNMLVICNSAILFYDLAAQNVANIEYLIGKYISYSDLCKLQKMKFENVIPEREGLLVDYQHTIPYTGIFIETTHTSSYFSKDVAKCGIYGYDTEQKVVRIPVGFALHLLEQYKNNLFRKCTTWAIHLHLFSVLSKAIAGNLYNKGVIMDFFEAQIGKKKDTFAFLSENADKLSRVNTFAIVARCIDNR